MIIENFIIFMNKILLFSSFINNAQGFPKPLTEKEEKEYFLKYKNGDKEAKDKLINHNLLQQVILIVTTSQQIPLKPYLELKHLLMSSMQIIDYMLHTSVVKEIHYT